MSAQIIDPNEPPQRARYEWLSQEINRLEELIKYNERKAKKLQGHTIASINKLIRTINDTINLHVPKHDQDINKT